MPFVHSPADVLRYLLISAGYGTLPTSALAWPIYAWQEPVEPDSVITLYDTEGQYEGRSQKDGECFQHEGVQIRLRTRAENIVAGNTNIRAILEYLDKQIQNKQITVPHITGTGNSVYLVHAVSRKGTINRLDKDGPIQRRVIFTVNVLVAMTQTTT